MSAEPLGMTLRGLGVPRADMRRLLVLLLVSLCSCSRCSGVAGSPDLPVAADEPRAIVKLSIDLHRGAVCEEAFDLEVYRDRGVDLVTWAPPLGRCSGRVVTIRYLPNRVKRDALLANVRKLAIKTEILEG